MSFGDVIFSFPIFLHKVDIMIKIRNLVLKFTHMKIVFQAQTCKKYLILKLLYHGSTSEPSSKFNSILCFNLHGNKQYC